MCSINVNISIILFISVLHKKNCERNIIITPIFFQVWKLKFREI